MRDLAVILVNWNTRDLTLAALESLYADLATSTLQAEVWVVDNASQDGSVTAIRERFPQTHLIASPENLGFGRANNAALRQLGFGAETPPEALPRAVYLLNSDTVSQPGATRRLYEALFSLPKAGLVGARLSYGDGRFQHSAFAFPTLAQLWLDLLPAPARLHETRLNGRYPRAFYTSGQPFRIGHPLGATMMLRREAILETGLFDERFFMYCEEVEWAWRIHRAGWGIYCVPEAHITHFGGQSTEQVRPQSVIYLWQSRLLMYDLLYPPWKRRLARALIRVGMRRKLRQTPSDPQFAALRQAYETVLNHAR
jgi:GT2 family glycosyltransferase